MKFKLDENLPNEVQNLLRKRGHEAARVVDQGLGGKRDEEIASVCRSEGRALVTLDLDFADIRSYPPGEYCGLVVLRIGRQDRETVLSTFERALGLLAEEPLERRLWIVEENRVRVRE